MKGSWTSILFLLFFLQFLWNLLPKMFPKALKNKVCFCFPFLYLFCFGWGLSRWPTTITHTHTQTPPTPQNAFFGGGWWSTSLFSSLAVFLLPLSLCFGLSCFFLCFLFSSSSPWIVFFIFFFFLCFPPQNKETKQTKRNKGLGCCGAARKGKNRSNKNKKEKKKTKTDFGNVSFVCFFLGFWFAQPHQKFQKFQTISFFVCVACARNETAKTIPTAAASQVGPGWADLRRAPVFSRTNLTLFFGGDTPESKPIKAKCPFQTTFFLQP